MRDPGTARPNPLFARDLDDSTGDHSDADTEPSESARSGVGGGSDWERLDELLMPSGGAAEAVVAAMLEAGPEAVEHLMNAGQELLLAAKAMLDAAERGLEEHRRSQADVDGGDDSNVRHLGLG